MFTDVYKCDINLLKKLNKTVLQENDEYVIWIFYITICVLCFGEFLPLLKRSNNCLSRLPAQNNVQFIQDAFKYGVLVRFRDCFVLLILIFRFRYLVITSRNWINYYNPFVSHISIIIELLDYTNILSIRYPWYVLQINSNVPGFLWQSDSTHGLLTN